MNDENNIPVDGGEADFEDTSGQDQINGEAVSEETPSYLFGDVTSDEATERFGYLRELPDHLRGLESRVGDAVSPVFDQLTALQEKIGSQPVFEPKMERFAAALKEYDPKFAEAALPALLEDLKEAMSVTPLGPEALSPHIQPMLQQAQQTILDQVVPTMLDSLPFDPDAIVNRDPANSDSVLEPSTDLQKDFSKWWEQADAPTRKALGTIGIPYVQALQRFSRWRTEQIRMKGKAAGEASARLSGATQKSTGGRRNTSSNQLETEADGFNSIFAKRS